MINPMRHLRLVLDDVGRHPGPGDFTRGWYELLGEKWRVNPFAVEERGVMSLVMAARDAAKMKKNDGAATVELLERVKQAYRILFTRALKGVYLWIPDPITRAYVNDSLHQ